MTVSPPKISSKLCLPLILFLCAILFALLGAAPYDDHWTAMVQALVGKRSLWQAFLPIYHPVARFHLYRPISVWIVQFKFFLGSYSPYLVFLFNGSLLGFFALSAYLFLKPIYGLVKSSLAVALTLATPVVLFSTWWFPETDVAGGAMIFLTLILFRRSLAVPSFPRTALSWISLFLTLALKETTALLTLLSLLAFLSSFATSMPQRKRIWKTFFLALSLAILLYIPALIAAYSTSPKMLGLTTLAPFLTLFKNTLTFILFKLHLLSNWTPKSIQLTPLVNIPFLTYHNLIQFIAAPLWTLLSLGLFSWIALKLPTKRGRVFFLFALLALFFPFPWQRFSFLGAYLLDPFPSSLLIALLLFLFLADQALPSAKDPLLARTLLLSLATFFLLPILLLYWRTDTSARIYIPLFPLFYLLLLLNIEKAWSRFSSTPALRQTILYFILFFVGWEATTSVYNAAAHFRALHTIEHQSRTKLLHLARHSNGIFFTHYIYRVSPLYLKLKSKQQPTSLLDPLLKPDTLAEHRHNLCQRWQEMGKPKGNLLVWHLKETRSPARIRPPAPFSWLRLQYDYLQTGNPHVYRDYPLPEMEARLLNKNVTGLEQLLTSQAALLFQQKRSILQLSNSPFLLLRHLSLSPLSPFSLTYSAAIYRLPPLSSLCEE